MKRLIFPDSFRSRRSRRLWAVSLVLGVGLLAAIGWKEPWKTADSVPPAPAADGKRGSIPRAPAASGRTEVAGDGRFTQWARFLREGTGFERAAAGGERRTPEAAPHRGAAAALPAEPWRWFAEGNAARAEWRPLVFADGRADDVVAMGAGGLVTQAEVAALISGLESSLTAIENQLISEVFGESLPLTGTKFATAANQAVPALRQVTGLKDALKSGLVALGGGATFTEVQVEQAVGNALTAAGIAHTGVNADASNPSDMKLFFSTTKSFPAVSIDLDTGMGMPWFAMQTGGQGGAQVNGQASVVFSYTMNLAVGVDSQGFYLNTANNASVFNVGFALTLPGFSVPMHYAKLRFVISDESGTDGDAVPPTSFSGTFGVDLLDPGIVGDRLRLNELAGTDLLNAAFTGNAAINLNLLTDLDTSVLPSLSADLNVAWSFSSALVDPLDVNASFGSVPAVAYRNVTLDLGSFLSRFAGPVLDQVIAVYEPVQPFVTAAKDPIPVLENLHALNAAIPTNLLGIAVANGSISQAQADRFDVMDKIIQIRQAFPTAPGAPVKIDLGDFNFGPATDVRVPSFDIAGITPNKIRTALAAELQHPLAQELIAALRSFPKDVPAGGTLGKGLQFPLLENPETVFGLFLGRPVDLFTLDNSTQTISFGSFSEFVPLSVPLGFQFGGGGRVRVDLDFGFDTAGILQFSESGNPLNIWNGFYVNVPVDEQNQPVAMAEFEADFNASASLDVLLAEAGAGGGLHANASATLVDPDNDRRVHLDEFIDEFTSDPLCVFNANGALDFGLRAYVSVGVWPIEETFEYEYPVGTVFDFSFACDDDPHPILARIDGGDARLHIGPEAPLREVGNTTDGSEHFHVTRAGSSPLGEEISITYHTNGGSSDAIGALTYGPVSGFIRGSGGAENDTIEFAADVTAPAQLSANGGLDRLVGGAGNDTLDGGDDHDVLLGRAGNDTLLGGNGPDTLDGGPGADVLDGGEGTDTVSFATSAAGVGINLLTQQHTGDAAGDTFLSIERFEGSPHADTMVGSPFSDSLFGMEGDDVLDGGEGDDALEGGPGADTLIGGPGYDYTTYFRSPVGVDVNLLNLVSHGGDAEGDTLSGIESLVGSEFDDTLTGNESDNYIDGGGGDDTLLGGGGSDWLIGGPGTNTIDGGGGNDTISGGDVSSIQGGGGDDNIAGSVVTFVDAGPGNDRFIGLAKKEAGQRDSVQGGEGDDFIQLGRPVAASPAQETDPPLPAFGVVGGIPRAAGIGGSDVDGGPGIDTLSFEGLQSAVYHGFAARVYGVYVNLATGTTGYSATETTISGIENVVGTDAYDHLIGDDGPNVFWPLRGGGFTDLNTGGPDRVEGAGGVDTVVIDFSLSDNATTTGVGTNGSDIGRVGADRYILNGVERLDITGTSFADQLSNAVAGYDDIFRGNGGNDYIGGNRGSDVLLGGEGDDTLVANGTFNLNATGAADGHDVLDGGPGDDMLDDFALNVAAGVNYYGVVAGSVFELDGGPGSDTFSVDLSNQTAPIVWSDATPTDLVFPDGTFVKNCERASRIATGSGNDDLTFALRTDNYARLGAGDDVVRPGLGFDSLDGGPGDDLLVLDFSADDQPDYGGAYVNSGYRRNRAVAPFELIDVIGYANFERYHVTGTTKNDALFGGEGDDILIGLDGNDTLTSYAGNDWIDGGPGNDVIRTRNSSAQAFACEIDAGPGNDEVYLDLTGAPFSSGVGYGNDTVTLGEGDDVLVALWFDLSFGRVSDVAGQVQRYDGGPGVDFGSVDFGKKTMPIEFIQGQDNSFDFPDGSHYRHFEDFLYFSSGEGNDRFVLLPVRQTHHVSMGPGNDWIEMGLGTKLAFGGPGEDTAVVDFSQGDDANVGGVFLSGSTYVRNDTATNQPVDRITFLEFEHVHYTGGSKADTGFGSNGSDILRGNGGNDSLRAYEGADLIVGCDPVHGRGAAEIDQITTDGGADIIVLGDASGRFYDDGNPATPGTDGYARITDFNPALDRLKLHGAPTSYVIGPSPIAGVTGSALFHDSNGNGALDATDELIATLGTAVITVANTLTPARSATAPPTLAEMGIAGLKAAPSGPGEQGRLKLTFDVAASAPADRKLELQATSDLTSGEWRVIAERLGGANWTGQAQVTVGAPTGGTVSTTAEPPDTGALREFYRMVVRPL